MYAGHFCVHHITFYILLPYRYALADNEIAFYHFTNISGSENYLPQRVFRDSLPLILSIEK